MTLFKKNRPWHHYDDVINSKPIFLKMLVNTNPHTNSGVPGRGEFCALRVKRVGRIPRSFSFWAKNMIILPSARFFVINPFKKKKEKRFFELT